ncbi:MAG: ribonuclease P protein component [Rhodospirillum sp.]|nr:ribonuclease P protein component [Rhodospirillum sp.]MCF8488911.1 ribonuclease P protein component [Rhodospirillum sp.]
MPSSQPDPALRFESFREDSEPPVESHRGKADTGPKEPGVKNPSAKILDPSDSSLIGRLKQRTDFLRVAGKRKKWAAPGLVLQVAPQPGATARRPAPDRPIRVGFTTSKKVGDAVDRNRARRRLRAAVDLVFPREAQTGRDYVVIGRAATVSRPFDLLVADLRAALKRLGARR